MNRIIILLLVVLISVVSFSCSREAEKPTITKVNMQDLNVPNGFKYETARTFNINLSGSISSPVTVKDPDDNALFRGMLNPERGINTKITLPYLVTQLKLEYLGRVYTIPVSGSSLNFTFPSYLAGR